MRIITVQITLIAAILMIFAVASAQDAGEFVRNGVEYLATGEYEMALEQFDQAIAANPDYPYAYAYRAMIGVKLGRYGEAVDDALKVLEYSDRMGPRDADPLRLMALSNLGTAYIRMGKNEAAVAVLHELIVLDDEDPIPYFLLGEALRGMDEEEKLEEALDAYTRAIRIDPGYAAAYFYRGVVKTRLGDEEGGMLDRERAIELDSGYMDR
jgi:tetratricopeptide (TPR) repeat protein